VQSLAARGFSSDCVARRRARREASESSCTARVVDGCRRSVSGGSAADSCRAGPGARAHALGATATPGLYWLPPLLAKYREAHRTYDLRFEIAPLHAIAERVARNDLDMAIVAGPLPTSELQSRRLTRDEFVIVAPPQSALARRRSAKASQLDSETWLLREEGSDTRRQVNAWWHRHRLAPTRTMTFDNPDAVKRSVTAGLGIAMISRLTVAEDLSARRLATVAVNTALPVRDVFVVDHPQKHHGAACRAMLQLLEQTSTDRAISGAK
jgi:DNA-binding transcriptional LysR family regulator